jgi:esterase/lipase superfamily enzyme
MGLLIICSVLLGMHTGCSDQSQESAMAQNFEVGQVWQYKTRPGEDDSRLYIVKIEPWMNGEKIFHIYADKLKIKNPLDTNGIQTEFSYGPVSEQTLKLSVTQLQEKTTTLPAISEGMGEMLLGKEAAKVLTISVSEIITAIENIVTQLHPETFKDIEDLEMPYSQFTPTSTPVPDHATVRVFFATDRNLTGMTNPSKMFGSDRAGITYGTCEVSIPRDHRMGELESPSIWRLEFRENPAKHVVLLKIVTASKDQFFADVTTQVRQSRASNAFLFVHGYNVTFEDAARRTAQITYDLGFDGAPTFYSWPSRGSTAAYTIDEQNIEWAQANLRSFLEDFFTRSDAQNVYLIAHSMGNRALTRAVASLLTDKPTLRNRLKEIILTAPDIDADVFKRDIAPALTAGGQSVTLYASSKDLALAASKKVHGYARAGDSGQGIIVVPGIETVDATQVDTSFLGHSYFADTRSVLADMFHMIRDGKRANDRFGLRPVETQSGQHWEFKP